MLEIYLIGIVIWICQEANHVWFSGKNSQQDYLWSLGLALIWPLAVLFLISAMAAVVFVGITDRWKNDA